MAGPVRCPVCRALCWRHDKATGRVYCPGRCRLWFDPAPGARVLDGWGVRL
ncbi:MAG: hypothetical protein ACYC2H_09990 [Thermoplasmatota archaeon]